MQNRFIVKTSGFTEYCVLCQTTGKRQMFSFDSFNEAQAICSNLNEQAPETQEREVNEYFV